MNPALIFLLTAVFVFGAWLSALGVLTYCDEISKLTKENRQLRKELETRKKWDEWDNPTEELTDGEG